MNKRIKIDRDLLTLPTDIIKLILQNCWQGQHHLSLVLVCKRFYFIIRSKEFCRNLKVDYFPCFYLIEHFIQLEQEFTPDNKNLTLLRLPHKEDTLRHKILMPNIDIPIIQNECISPINFAFALFYHYDESFIFSTFSMTEKWKYILKFLDSNNIWLELSSNKYWDISDYIFKIPDFFTCPDSLRLAVLSQATQFFSTVNRRNIKKDLCQFFPLVWEDCHHRGMELYRLVDDHWIIESMLKSFIIDFNFLAIIMRSDDPRFKIYISRYLATPLSELPINRNILSKINSCNNIFLIELVLEKIGIEKWFEMEAQLNYKLRFKYAKTIDHILLRSYDSADNLFFESMRSHKLWCNNIRLLENYIANALILEFPEKAIEVAKTYNIRFNIYIILYHTGDLGDNIFEYLILYPEYFYLEVDIKPLEWNKTSIAEKLEDIYKDNLNLANKIKFLYKQCFSLIFYDLIACNKTRKKDFDECKELYQFCGIDKKDIVLICKCIHCKKKKMLL